MIKLRPAAERGKTQTAWLDSNHTFSFNRYYDPEWSGFRDLLVINDDFVAPSQGFGAHSHQDMEILSYLVSGELAHKDSTGTSAVIRPGETQRMTAGTGVTHSEFNPSRTEPTHFLQIWILPEQQGLKPGYEQREFPAEARVGKLRLVVSRDGANNSVRIHQDVKVYESLLTAGEETSYEFEPGRHGWIQVVNGDLVVNGTALQTGDGVAISDEKDVALSTKTNCQILLFDLA